MSEQDKLQAMIQLFGTSAAHALTGFRQSTALIQVLIEKGIITKGDIDEKMGSTEDLVEQLDALCDRLLPSDE